MEHASAAIDRNYTNQKAHASLSCIPYMSYKANRAHGSLVDSGADVDRKSKHLHTAQHNIFAITMRLLNERTNLITQLRSTLNK
jgi:hypothetical protein